LNPAVRHPPSSTSVCHHPKISVSSACPERWTCLEASLEQRGVLPVWLEALDCITQDRRVVLFTPVGNDLDDFVHGVHPSLTLYAVFHFDERSSLSGGVQLEWNGDALEVTTHT
jgi:hypothetical protein